MSHLVLVLGTLAGLAAAIYLAGWRRAGLRNRSPRCAKPPSP
jgi:hypothetical protein